MDEMMALDFSMRFLHIATAICLVGGSVFVAYVLAPAANISIEQDQHDKLRAAIGQRWKWFVHLGITLFLITGFYNYYQAIPRHKGDGLYHAFLGTKILLALFVMFIASALAGRSKAFEAMRNRRGLWLNILVLTAAVVIALSSYVRTRSLTPAPTQQATVSETEVSKT